MYLKLSGLFPTPPPNNNVPVEQEIIRMFCSLYCMSLSTNIGVYILWLHLQEGKISTCMKSTF